MEVIVKSDNNVVTLSPQGRLDFSSAPDLQKAVEENASRADKMVLDMSAVDYISSAGLRVILFSDNLMREKNGLWIKNCNDSVKEIFDITGFSAVLNIE